MGKDTRRYRVLITVFVNLICPLKKASEEERVAAEGDAKQQQ